VITEWEGWTIPSVAVDTRIEVEIDTSCRSLLSSETRHRSAHSVQTDEMPPHRGPVTHLANPSNRNLLRNTLRATFFLSQCPNDRRIRTCPALGTSSGRAMGLCIGGRRMPEHSSSHNSRRRCRRCNRSRW
jgi:hypothetical protein